MHEIAFEMEKKYLQANEIRAASVETRMLWQVAGREDDGFEDPHGAIFRDLDSQQKKRFVSALINVVDYPKTVTYLVHILSEADPARLRHAIKDTLPVLLEYSSSMFPSKKSALNTFMDTWTDLNNSSPSGDDTITTQLRELVNTTFPLNDKITSIECVWRHTYHWLLVQALQQQR